ncbi:c-type cytochrome biogenesis protein CcsB [Paenibacillus albiflavus]|uniref:C-type cytochrome biogenesis protein CcsB n=1 Tax=Paenibacillus albiflavus TaxID=2545760 RepID=A0A4R4EMF5_9BACL|nr:cytochrome c biogenesis protein CcsA [Paenibacillus albiflavus]TCZ81249.1 c-type cytochrome biogenesis protein CcsB [Paenibacillus albiflavus]
MSLDSLSSSALLIAFFVYLVAFIIFVLAILGKKWSRDLSAETAARHVKKWGWAGYVIAAIGFVCQVVYFISRWIEAGHIPTSNLFEFLTFFGMMVILAFLVVYLIYRTPVFGIFAMPVGFIIIAYASVFPSEIQPLVPSLKSYWLNIHVTTAALGEAFFAVGFAAGLMYLIRMVNFQGTSKTDRRERRGVEFSLFTIVALVSFIVLIFAFNSAGYSAKFQIETTVKGEVTVEESNYVLPPIVSPSTSTLVQMDTFLGMKEPLFEAPAWMKGASAGRKLNTVIWSAIVGFLAYGLLRLIARKPLGAALSPLVQGVDPEDLDEISYRGIAIGYPIFTLGGLIFAMIWAQEAWGRFWGWDPKEVWALITWLFYAVLLHFRLSRGWVGKRSAWLAVIGFLVVMFTLIGVNLIIAGLHSYAGV